MTRPELLVAELRIMNEQRHGRPDWQYRSLPALVLDAGVPFETPMALPPSVTPEAPQHCYENALKVALRHNFAYVEGFGIHAGLSTATLHARCGVRFEDSWIAIDSTWAPNTDNAYFGVPFDPRWVEQHLESVFLAEMANPDAMPIDKQACLLDDWQRGYPCLRDGIPLDAAFDSP